MKNKGFTLIEILSVIIILGLIGTVVTISLTKSLNNTKSEKCKNFVIEIEDAACTYAGLKRRQNEDGYPACNQSTNGCTLTLQQLISLGLLEEKKDDCTEEDMNMASTVIVTFSNGEKICRYQGIREYAK